MTVVEPEQFAVVVVLQDEPIVAIEQAKALGNTLDRVVELNPRLVELAQVVFLDLDRSPAEDFQRSRHLRDFVFRPVDNRFIEITVGNRRHIVAEVLEPANDATVDEQPDDQRRAQQRQQYHGNHERTTIPLHGLRIAIGGIDIPQRGGYQPIHRGGQLL